MALTKIADGGMPAGAVLQVVSTSKTDDFSSSSSSFADITGMSVAITPSSTSSKILVIVYCSIVSDDSTGLKLLRDSTAISFADADGSRQRYSMIGFLGTASNEVYNAGANHMHFLDSPSSTSALTYKLQGIARSGSFYINRTIYDTDNTASGRGTSTITAMEIAG
jgi:hypothetical protein